MRILLVNHGTASEWGGGDGVQIRETAKRLAQRGHHVQAVNADQPDARASTSCTCSTAGWRFIPTASGQLQTGRCTCGGLTHLDFVSKALWGSRGTMSVLQQATNGASSANVHSLLEKLRNRELVVQLPKGAINAEGYGEECWPVNRNVLKDLLHQVDGLLPNSWLELQAIRNDLNWHGETFEIAHYGVDPALFLDPDPDAFRKATGIKTPFVLQAGRIEPAKNQAMLCWALRETNLPIVLIGASKHWPAYADLCRKISGDKLQIIDHLPQPLLASAYAAAAVHVLPSWMETCGLVSLEAALAGAPLVGSTFGHELEYLEGDAWYSDPGDGDSLRTAVINAWQAGRNHPRALAMRRKVLERFNWDRTVDATENLYRRVLSAKK